MGGSSLLSAFERYAALGWSCIPIASTGTHKKSLVRWKTFQRERPTLSNYTDWARRWPSANIAVICGKISRVVAIDIDDPELAKDLVAELPATATVKTKRGWHYYYRLPDGCGIVETKKPLGPGSECRGELGYAVLPPSIHESGSLYMWEREPDVITDIPDWLVRMVADAKGEILSTRSDLGTPLWKSGLLGVTDGARNVTAASLIGRLIHDLRDDAMWSLAWEAVKSWNLTNSPAMDMDELETTFSSICESEMDKRRRDGNQGNRPSVINNGATEMDYVVPGYGISNLLIEGATMLSGKPKRGKSWLVLQWALSIAEGTAPFRVPVSLAEVASERRFEPTAGSVLYLALEDSKARLCSRMSKLLPPGADFPKRFSWATEFRSIFNGGLYDIEHWINDHPDARLVVIDTLAAFSGDYAPPRGVSAFAAEYRLMKPIGELARSRKVPILVVTHSRKTPRGGESDIFDSTSGTLGGNAAVDTIIVLHRHAQRKHARLLVEGRDIDMFDLAIRQDDGWQLSTLQALMDEEAAIKKKSRLLDSHSSTKS